MEPHEVDPAFHGTARGQVFECILAAFAVRNTYEHNHRYPPGIWIDLLSTYYRAAPYLKQMKYVEFTGDVLSQVIELGPPDAILNTTVIQAFEPLTVKRQVGRELRNSWRDYVVSEIGYLVDVGLDLEARSVDIETQGIEEWSAASIEYEAWKSGLNELEELRDFFEWAPFSLPKVYEELDQLVYVEIPDPPGPEPDSEYFRSGAEEYWTVERIFADL